MSTITRKVDEPMAQATLTLKNGAGLHARPAAMFVQTAGRYEATVRVSNLTQESSAANAKSILSVLGLGAECGHTILIEAEGPDAADAIAGLRALVESAFGEGLQ
jgi:phosphotransferase system HPr (HPr) family protein